MECNTETFEIFSKHKCAMIMMEGKEKQVYETPKGDMLFFYPSRNKMTLNKVVGRDEEMNMPIVRDEINEKLWEVKNNSELNNILNSLMFDLLLPKGLTCKDCFHSNRCSTLFGGDDSNISCQFSPSRFRPT